MDMMLQDKVAVVSGGSRGIGFHIARDLAAGPTHLQAMAKESFHMSWRRSLEEATEFEIQNVMKSLDDPYFTKALTNFLSKDSRSNVETVRLP